MMILHMNLKNKTLHFKRSGYAGSALWPHTHNICENNAKQGIVSLLRVALY